MICALDECPSLFSDFSGMDKGMVVGFTFVVMEFMIGMLRKVL